MDFESSCTSLAGDLSEQLRKPHSFIVTGPQYVLSRSLRECLDAGMAGDSDGLILWISLGDIRTASMQRMLQELSATSSSPQSILVVSPSMLMQQMAQNSAGFLSTIRRCRRFLVWLHPIDFSDCALIQWLQLYAQIPANMRAGVAYFWSFATPPDLSLIRALHGEISTIDIPRPTCNSAIAIEYVPSSASYSFSPEFKSICQKSDSLVSCRFDKTRMKYSEWSHGIHISVYGRDTQKMAHANERYQFGVNDGMRAFLHDDWIFDHVVSIDPGPYDDVRSLATSWIEQSPIATIVTTSRFALLYAAANCDDSCQLQANPPKWLHRCYLAYSMFDALSRYETICLTNQNNREFATNIFEYWISQGYIDPRPPHAPTAKGRALFPGVQHIDMLGGLFNYNHETRCESPGHQFCAYITSGFLRMRSTARFAMSGESWQRHFYHVLSNESIIRPETAPTPTAWLDCMPFICDDTHTRKIEQLLYEPQISPQIRLSAPASEALSELRKSFADAPAHRFIETTNGVACWWTFAGSAANAAVAILLKSLAPKLTISFGNLCLRISWAAVTGSAEKAADRFKSLCAQMDALRQHKQQIPAQVRTEYLQNHMLGWMMPIMPPSLQDELFDDFWCALDQAFEQGCPPVIVTDQCHTIDDLPFAFLSPEQPAKAKAEKQPRAEAQHAQHQAPKSEVSFPATPHVPIIPGIMHTRMPWTYIDNEPALNKAINIILKQPYIGLDVETTLYHQELCLIQIGCADRSFIIDPLRVDFSGLAQVFEHPAIIKIIHNATFEKTVLKKYGMQINNIVDTMRVSQKIYGRKCDGGHSLKSVCMREFGLDMDKTNQTSRWDLRPLTPHQLEYAALDAEILIHLYRHFCERSHPN